MDAKKSGRDGRLPDYKFRQLVTMASVMVLIGVLGGCCSKSSSNIRTTPLSISFHSNDNESFWNQIFSNIGTISALLITQAIAIYIVYKQLKSSKDNIDRQFLLQKYHADANFYEPIFSEILRDLSILHSFLNYRGDFCPLIEHRQPYFTAKDSSLESSPHESISIAQRAYQCFSIGLKIVNNCTRIIHLAKKEDLPEVLQLCSNIKETLFMPEQEKNAKLQIMRTDLQNHLAYIHFDSHCSQESKDRLAQDQEMILNFYQKLDAAIAKELPHLGDRNITKHNE